VIEARRAQLGFAEGLISEEVSDLWNDWMRAADQVLDDDPLLTTVYEALAKRRPKSRTRGRLGTPAEVVLRLLLLKHIRNWSYEVVEREVRANLVYRSFTRVGGGKVPDDTVMNKWALALGPEVIENIHKRAVAIAQEKTGVKTSRDVFKQAALEGLRKELDTMAPRVKQVMQQARARIFGG
jgi:IS5 family transposase